MRIYRPLINPRKQTMSTRSILESKFQIDTTYIFESTDNGADILSPVRAVKLLGPEGITHYLQSTLKKQSHTIGSATGSITAHTSDPNTFLTDVLKTLLELERWLDEVVNIDYFRHAEHPYPLVNLLSRHYNHGRGQTFKDWIKEQCDVDEILKGVSFNNNLGLEIAAIRKYENVIIFTSDSEARIRNVKDLINNLSGPLTMYAHILPGKDGFLTNLEVKVFEDQIHEALAKI